MSKKIDFLKLKLKSYYTFKKLIFLNYKNSILYVECILLSIVLSILTPHLIDLLQLLNYLPVYDFNTLKINYTNLYTNTGIGLIGLSGLIFTLKTFKKQSLDEYMNSIFQKTFIDKLDTYIEYGYICLISVLFLLIPNVSIFEQNISLFISFYYFSLICILFMFGVELFIISNNMNKTNILKELKTRVKYLYDIGEKLGKYHSEYEKKYNNKQSSELQFIDKMNYTFLSYIQCINMIARKSFNDPIIFVQSMDTLYEITKYRLDIRKNKFNDYSVPLLSEVMPNPSNDTFIENHLLEYLDDYTKLALEQKNRDNMGTIERMYKQLLIAGKDNRYMNNNNLELTIKIIFIYYLKMINDIVKFNNENMLFQTIEMFRQLFINNGKYFNELVDKQFCDSMYQLSIESLQNKSLMNYRNIQGLLTIGFAGVLFNNYEYRSIYLDEIFKTLKLDLEAFYNSRRLIVEYNGARPYLNYILNSLEPLSILSVFRSFYNSNISPDGRFVNMEIISENDFRRLLDFINDKDVMNWLIDLHNKRYYITCDTDVSEICTFLLQISSIICNTIDDQNIKDEYYELFDKTLKVSAIYISKFNENSSMMRHKMDEYYSNIVYLSKHIIKQDNHLKLILFNHYKKSIIQTYKDFDNEFSIENFLKYFESISIIFDEKEKQKEIKSVLEEIADLLLDAKKFIIEFVNLKSRNHSFIGFNNSEIRNYIEPTMLEVVIDKADNMNKKDIEFICNKITKNEINKRINKKELLKMLKESLQK